METLYSTGIRVSELVGLNLGQVDFIGGMIKVYGKGRKERLSPIGDKALQALRKYLSKLATEEKENQALFLDRGNKRLTDEGVRKVVSKYIRQISLSEKASFN